jgi:hypothetical protein
MNDDVICQFLRALPGYNPTNIEADRHKIVSGGYDLDEPPYLWQDAQSMNNPDRGSAIGLFLAMCDKRFNILVYTLHPKVRPVDWHSSVILR